MTPHPILAVTALRITARTSGDGVVHYIRKDLPVRVFQGDERSLRDAILNIVRKELTLPCTEQDNPPVELTVRCLEEKGSLSEPKNVTALVQRPQLWECKLPEAKSPLHDLPPDGEFCLSFGATIIPMEGAGDPLRVDRAVVFPMLMKSTNAQDLVDTAVQRVERHLGLRQEFPATPDTLLIMPVNVSDGLFFHNGHLTAWPGSVLLIPPATKPAEA